MTVPRCGMAWRRGGSAGLEPGDVGRFDKWLSQGRYAIGHCSRNPLSDVVYEKRLKPFNSQDYFPLDPNPLAPRAASLNSSSTTSPARNGCSSNCAILSPLRME